MQLKLALLFTFLGGAILSAQDKTINTFKEVLIDGYNSAGIFTPITIIDGNTGAKKYLLSNTEALYYATEIEYNILDIDSLYAIISKNADNQQYEFKKPEALESFSLSIPAIDPNVIAGIDKVIAEKHIIEGLKLLYEQRKKNRLLLEEIYPKLYIIRDSLKAARPDFSEKEIKLVNYLTTWYDYDEDLENMGNIRRFETAKEVFNLWKKSTKQYSKKMEAAYKIEEKLERKYVTKYLDKYHSNYIVALFKYGAIFSWDDVGGTINFSGIID